MVGIFDANKAFGQAALRCLPQPRAQFLPHCAAERRILDPGLAQFASFHSTVSGRTGTISPVTTAEIPARDAGERAAPGHREGQNRRVDLARIGWLVTVLICLVAVLILTIQGYLGYAGVTLAVAIAAAINLF